MNLDRIVNFDDMKRLAKRKLPKIIFDFIEGGVEDEVNIHRNSDAFKDFKLWPRYFGEMAPFEASTDLFGQTYAQPFGIGATGMAGLFRPGADLMLARQARLSRIPFVASTYTNASIETLAKEAGDYCWFQLYGARDRGITADMIARARDCGIKVLVVTIDSPTNSKRERNVRNGFGRPLRMSLPVFLEALTHPGWIYRYFRDGGIPMFDNWIKYAGADASASDVADFGSAQTPNRQTWADLETARKLWPHTLVVKGVMHPEDAIKAADIGADGIIVSNHGGRALDRTPATIEVLPLIADAVGDRTTVMLDSGIKRGSDAITAYCLGARFVFFGRPTLYGVAAAGQQGVARIIQLLTKELDTTMNQIGASRLSDLGPRFLFPRREDRTPVLLGRDAPSGHSHLTLHAAEPVNGRADELI